VMDELAVKVNAYGVNCRFSPGCAGNHHIRGRLLRCLFGVVQSPRGNGGTPYCSISPGSGKKIKNAGPGTDPWIPPINRAAGQARR
jgi:hypothetical protein